MREMVILLDRIPEFNLESSSETGWKDWLTTFNCIMDVILEDLSERRKISCLTNKLLPSFMPVFIALEVDLEHGTFEKVVSSLTHYFRGINRRVTFLRRLQRSGESFDEFAKNLDALSSTCGFAESERLPLIRDMFVINLHPRFANIQKKLILEGIDLPLKHYVALADKLLKENGADSDPVVASSPEARHSQGGSVPRFGEEIHVPQVHLKTITPGEIVEVVVVGSEDDTFFVWPSVLKDNRQQFLASLQREVLRENNKRNVSPDNFDNNKFVAFFQGDWFRVIILDVNLKLGVVRALSMDFGWVKKIPNSALRSAPPGFIVVHPLAVPIRTSDSLTVGELYPLKFLNLNDGVWSVTLSTLGDGTSNFESDDKKSGETSPSAINAKDRLEVNGARTVSEPERDCNRPGAGRSSSRQGREIEDSRIDKSSRNGSTSDVPGSRRNLFAENKSEPKVHLDLSSLKDRAHSGDSRRPPIPIGEFATVKVTFVAPIGTVHVCLEKDWMTLQEISDMISEGNHKPILQAHDGFRCAAKFENFWCRARIETVDRTKGVAHVTFLDWGNEEWVKISELFFLPGDLAVTPLPLSFPIVVPSRGALVEGCSLTIRIKEKDASGAWAVELKDCPDANEGGRKSSSRPARDHSLQSRPITNVEGGHFEQFGSRSGSTRHVRPNDGGVSQSRQASADCDSRRIRYSSEDRGNRGPKDGDFRLGGNRGSVDGDSRMGRSSACDEREHRDKTCSMNSDSGQSRPYANVGRGNRDQSRIRQRGADASCERVPLDKFGTSNGDSHPGRPNAMVEREHQDKPEPMNGDSHQGVTIASGFRVSRNSCQSDRDDKDIPDMKKLSIDSQNPPVPSDCFTTVKVVDNSSGISVFNMDFQDDVQRFYGLLNEWYGRPDNLKVVTDLRNGLLVAAQWCNEWYRAEIISLQDGGRKALVKFVDWGNEDLVETSHLMVLHSDLKQAPVFTFAIKVPKPVNPAVGDLLNVKPKCLDVDGSWVVEVEGVPDNKPPLMPAHDANGSTPARRDDASPRPAQSFNSNVEVAPAKPSPIQSDSFTDVQVMYIGREGTFATPLDKLAAVANIFNEVVKAAETAGPGLPEVDSIVAAPFDGQIFRAKVISTNPRASTARVCFVDFGNESDVSFSSLLAIPAHLAKDIHNFKFKLDPSFDRPIVEGDKLAVKAVALEPDGAWLLQVHA